VFHAHTVNQKVVELFEVIAEILILPRVTNQAPCRHIVAVYSNVVHIGAFGIVPFFFWRKSEVIEHHPRLKTACSRAQFIFVYTHTENLAHAVAIWHKPRHFHTNIAVAHLAVN
jgi:hypothetical protein